MKEEGGRGKATKSEGKRKVGRSVGREGGRIRREGGRIRREGGREGDRNGGRKKGEIVWERKGGEGKAISVIKNATKEER